MTERSETIMPELPPAYRLLAGVLEELRDLGLLKPQAPNSESMAVGLAFCGPATIREWISMEGVR
ncbi:hypothetical protein [Kineococcus sp. SYSU DK006]|uniref:hypothetical protein n=1 Tax=Kineococcus sp. SYSU DK006 TaxID=3383127 RepID=UPI003D7DB9CC